MSDKKFYEAEVDNIHYFNFHYAVGNGYPAHFHASREILFVKKGIVTVKVNGKEHTLNDGDILVSNEYDVHCYIGGSDSEVYVLLFGDYFYKNKKIMFENILKKREGTQEIFNLLELFIDKGSTSSFSNVNMEMKVGFISFLYGMLKQYYNDKIIENKDNNNTVAVDILMYIQKNCDKNLKLTDVAKEFSYSNSYFSVLFNNITNMSFNDYLNHVRLEKMKKLLEQNNDMQISTAAMMCGFGSLNTYYRAKKKMENNNNFMWMYK